MRDEDPSEEDLRRLDSDTAYCPHCGAEIWDQAESCPECGDAISSASSRPALDTWLRRRWIAFVAILAIILLVVFLVL